MPSTATTAYIAAFTDPADTIDAATTPDDTIDTALLDTLHRLTRHDGELIAWAKLRSRLPGTLNRQAEALLRLWHGYRLDVMKIDGLNYVIANDALDERIADIERARHPHTPRQLRVLDS